MRKGLLVLVSLLAMCDLIAQQLNQLSMTLFHPYKDYAAYGGFDRTVNLTVLSRNQWNGIEGDPKMQYIGVHLPFYAVKGGAGFDISNMTEGNFRHNYLRLSINKVFETNYGVLSIAGRVGGSSVKFGLNGVTTPEGIYSPGTTIHNDPLLNKDITGFGIGWELGMWFRGGRYQGGLSISDQPSPFINPEQGFSFDKNINLFFNTFYDVTETIQIQPFVNIKSNFNQVQTEISGVARFNGNIFGGIMMRGYSSSSVDALGIMVGHRLSKTYSFYYQFDAGLSSLRKTNEGSHEIILKIDINALPKSGLPPKIIYNPRYLE
jgi:type IX secretion system PorP/SprF family membrane protein